MPACISLVFLMAVLSVSNESVHGRFGTSSKDEAMNCGVGEVVKYCILR